MTTKRNPRKSPSSVAAAPGRSRPRPAAVKPAVPGCPIVGIGASLGGLKAFTELIEHLPPDTGFAFVLVQHLDPQHESTLASLLAQVTSMPVQEVTDKLRVEPNHVYVIPPNRSMGIAQGILTLRPRVRNDGAPHSIDAFLEALAKDQGERAIGVVLSGSGTDGTLGLEAIKAHHGITFVQDAASARSVSMPGSAMAGGVDYVLSPAEIAGELARIAAHPYVARSLSLSPSAAEADDAIGSSPSVTQEGPAAQTPDSELSAKELAALREILRLMRSHSGVDFSLYKSATIHRRIVRRTVLNKQHGLESYAESLRGNVPELDALYADMLIGVTNFFRNPEAFDVLERKVFPALLQQQTQDPVRVWVLGCSTGQEAFSLAMSFAETADKLRQSRPFQVFATDLNESVLEKARSGLYARNLVQDVSPERLKRFFVEEKEGYRIIKSLRDQVVFARQDLTSDPPFSRMDLISCRNLMIYLVPALQGKVLPTFHYALNPGGFLFLGASESIGSFTDLFEPVDKKQKIFARKAAPTLAFHLPLRKEWAQRSAPGRPPRPVASARKMSVRADLSGIDPQREADRVTLSRFAPPGVLIDDRLQILQFRGPTGSYLEPPPGKASFDLLKMAREGLMLPLRATINRARKENKPASKKNITLTQNGKILRLNLEVVPLRNLPEPCFLVLFDEIQTAGETAAATPARPATAAARKAEARRIADLEQELTETRDYLRSIQDGHQAAHEELQAANDEGQSANEELQSLNEELETAKEELESTNEELTAANEQMADRNGELNRVNSDLTNVETSTKLVILLLNRDLTLRRFSVQAGRKFNLLAKDLSRPLGNVQQILQLTDLDAVIARVMASGREHESEVRDREGHWYSLQVRPYLGSGDQMDGVVLVLLDIDALKRTERLLIEEREHAETIVRTVQNPLVVLTADLQFHSANDAFYRTFKLAPREAHGRSIFELDEGSWNIPALRRLLEEIVPRSSFFNDLEVTHNFKRIGRRTLLLNARLLHDPAGAPREILLGIQDVTEVLAFQVNLRRSEMRYRRLFETSETGILMLDPVTQKITEANPTLIKLLGYSREQLLKKELWEIGLIGDETASRDAFRELKKTGSLRYDNLPLATHWGQRREVELIANIYHEDGMEVIQCNVRDITARKQAEEVLRESEERYRALFNSIDEGFCVVEVLFAEDGRAADYRFLEVNDSFAKQAGMIDVAGKLMRQLVPAHEEYWFEIYGKVARTGQPMRFTNEARELKRWFDAYAFRLDGRYPNKVAILFRDITERRQAEEALRQARAKLADHAGQLESLVAERTAELTATNRQLEAYAYSIAHDLRAPLRAMQGFSEMLMEEAGAGLSERSRGYAERIGQSALLMDALLGDLLAFSRLSQQRVELTAVNLSGAVDTMLERLQADLREKNAVVEKPGSWPCVLAHEPTLIQVLLNLASNALKFMVPGQRPLLQLRAEERAEGWVRVVVEDNGLGIAPEYQEQIFRLFTRLHGDKYPGTGIGLAIVQKGVERMNGRMGVESAAGQGSRFWFELRKAEPPRAEDA